MIPIIEARTLVMIKPEELWNWIDGKFYLQFEDGMEILTNHVETIISAHYWHFHRYFQEVPITHQHHIAAHHNGKVIKKDTYNKLCQRILFDTGSVVNLTHVKDREILTKLAFFCTNMMYNDFCERSEKYMDSIDILDFFELMNNEEMEEVRKKKTQTRQYVDEIYDVASKLLNATDEKSLNNPIVRGRHNGTVKYDQAKQCIGARGVMTHIDGVTIPTPIVNGFADGLTDVFEVIVESLSAQKALLYAEAPLEDTSYFARRLATLTMLVERIVYGDCGSQEYLNFRVKPKDVKNILGNFYLNEETNQLEEITMGSASKIVGKMIKMRTAYACTLENPHEICSTCFGTLYYNTGHNTNIGYSASSNLCSKSQQLVLSTKHVIVSAVGGVIALSPNAREWFKAMKNMSVGILPEVKNKIKLKFLSFECFGLTDIATTNDINDLLPSRISKINTCVIMTLFNGAQVELPVTIANSDRSAVFSRQFLLYLKIHGWELTEQGDFIIDLKHWDAAQPMFVLPEAESDYAMHAKHISYVIESKMDEIDERLNPQSPAATLIELFDVVNSKLDINISLLSVLIYASMIADGQNDNYNLARNSPYRSLGVARDTVLNRSLGTSLAFNYQAQTLTEARTFFGGNRPDGPMDVLISPKEVTEHYKDKW